LFDSILRRELTRAVIFAEFSGNSDINKSNCKIRSKLARNFYSHKMEFE